jgi:hypothetical protein
LRYGLRVLGRLLCLLFFSDYGFYLWFFNDFFNVRNRFDRLHNYRWFPVLRPFAHVLLLIGGILKGSDTRWL